MNPAAKAILDDLLEGNQRYVENNLTATHLHETQRRDTVYGQKPKAAVLGCADSRVISEIIFDQSIGDLFVTRVAGNIASQGAIASLEFAVMALEVGVIVVLGHQSCGAVTAAWQSAQVPNNLAQLVEEIIPVVKPHKSNPSTDMNVLVKENILHVCKLLCERSDVIQAAVDEGKLEIIPVFYFLDSGKVELL